MAYSMSERNQARELLQLLRPFFPWILLSAITGVGAGAATVALLGVVNQVLAGGSGMANSEADIQKLCPVAVLRPGLLVAAKATRAPETEAAIRKWVAEG